MCETRRWGAAPHKVVFKNIFTMIILIIMVSMISTTKSCCENLADYQKRFRRC